MSEETGGTPAPEARDRARMRAEFEATHGYWTAQWQEILDTDPEYFAAYVALAGVPAKGVLEPKVRDLIALAVNASVTHLHAPGVRAHLRAALANGATQAEILETLRLVAVLGIHAMSTGAPLLVEVLRQRGMPVADMDEHRAGVQARFIDRRGYWDAAWDDVLALAPEFFAAYLDYSALPWEHGTLPPKVKELIYVAIDASATHLYAGGLRVHMENALDHGAGAAEITQVLEIASLIGCQTLELALPILREHATRAEHAGPRNNTESIADEEE